MDSHELLTRAVEDVVPRKVAEEKLKTGNPLRIYLGIDPTGAQLHIGHSVPLLKLRAFQDAGHHVIFLIGSFTALIGDPTGREVTRPMLTEKEVMRNFQTYKDQASHILDFSKLEIRQNDEWLNKMGIADVMALAGHFTIQQMMQRDMFKERMARGDPLTPNEFMYPLMQGYDSVVLDVDCEVGGNDQLFNMLCGRTLQKAYRKREKFVLTTKLIEGTDGRKMSKSYDNCIYMTDPADTMYGKVLSVKDELIPTYLECCTRIPMSEVTQLIRDLRAKKTNPKDIKMRLAREIVTMYYSEAAAKEAEEGFENVFKNKGVPEDMPEYKAKKGESLIDALVASGSVTSKSGARRLIEQGGIKVNDKAVADVNAKAEGGVVKVGKRKFLKIKA